MNQSPDNMEFSYANWRKGFLRVTLIIASAAGLVAVIPAVIGATNAVYSGLYIGVYLVLLVLTFAPVPTSLKSVIVTGLIFSLGILGLSESGIRGDAPLFMLGAITMASLLFSWRAGWVVTGLAMLSFLIAGALVVGEMVFLTSKEVTPGTVETWASGSTGVLLLAVILVNGIRLTQEEFGKAQRHAQNILESLQNEKNLLAQRVESRTQDLASANQVNEYRARMFQAIAQVTRAIISTQNLQDLLPLITQAISQYFGFYHIGIFLINASREYAVLSAANSEGGQVMLENDHKLRVGQTGIVGYVAKTGKPRIALDTGADAVYFNNPHLPETRSEMALPLVQTGGQVIGVLDIQSTKPNAFTNEDIEILITLADQVSVAIANARMYEETQKNLLEAEILYRRDLQTSWKRFVNSQKIAGIHRTGMSASLYAEPMALPGAEEVTAFGSTHFTEGEVSQLTMPVKLRGEVVGLLNVKTDEKRKWTGDEMDIIAAIVERAALSIENTRLLTESQKTAEKERAIGEISARIGASTQIETILKTAIQELGNALSDTDIAIQFKGSREPE